MGNLERKNKFKVKEESVAPEDKSVVTKIAKKDNQSKMISASVNVDNYAAFTRINKSKGMSNNSALNMLIAEYVENNGHLK